MKTIDCQNKAMTFNVAIVASRFNEEVVKKLVDGALTRLKEKKFTDNQILLVWVPGAVEIPIAAQRIAQQGVYDAIIAIGAVIRGDTTHYDYVCDQVSQGCQHVALQNDVPVIFSVITTENDEQAMARAGGAHGNKGIDGVDAAIEMVSCLREIG